MTRTAPLYDPASVDFAGRAPEIYRQLRDEHMPLDETLAIVGTLDAIRAQVGVVYPGE